jgi:hypothetical protein
MTQSILNKINELFHSTPKNIGVGYGYKIVNGEYTNEKGIIFHVEKKLPLSELSNEEILPSTVEIDNVVYKTDVFETGKIEYLVCNNSSSNPCFPTGYPPPDYATPNASLQRPFLGGSGCETPAGGGTVGFVAKHTATQKIVGVTNAHVMFVDTYNSISKQSLPVAWMYDSFLYGNGISQGTYDPNTSIVGKTLYAKSKKRDPFGNFVDAALISLFQTDSFGAPVITSESWKQVGINIGTTPPPFATTAELDNLLADPNMEVASTGLRTGAKQGTCGLRISAIGVNTYVSGDYYFYQNQITFTRIDPTCRWPCGGGDSGSAVFGKIGGVWKIIGLLWGGGGESNTGFMSRIDYVASELGIEAWDGVVTAQSFIDSNTIQGIITTGVSAEDSIIVNGKVYKQSSATFNSPITTTTTTTII